MDKRKIIIYMIISLIFIILLLILLILNNTSEENKVNNNMVTNNNVISNNVIGNNVNNQNTNNIIEGEPSNEISQGDNYTLEVTEDYFDVKINSVYFAIKDIADDFFENINKDTEKLYAVLGKDYINKNGITKQNLTQTFSTYANSTFYIEKILQKIEENNICKFILYGTINGNTDYNMAIVTDETNMNYCIYPYEYLKTNDINNLKINTIASNEYNKLEYKDINNEKLSQYHLSNYIYYAQNNVEKLYEKLDSEYSKKRFGSLEKFKEYINSNINMIKNSSLTSYKVTRDGDYLQYNCIDNYGNIYTFKEIATMQYTLMLDNYTIMSEEDIEYYNNLDKFDKSKYNLNKFITMVNTKDYSAIYNVLDITFRTNNFKEQSNLEEFIKNNMYSLNSIEIDSFDDETYEYYIFECKISNMENINQSKKMTIIINQSEGTDFTMSFSFE